MTNYLKQFEALFEPDQREIVADVEEFAEWHIGRRTVAFDPKEATDVDLKNYLLHLRLAGHSHDNLQSKVKSLRTFYEWVHEEGIISSDELARFDIGKSFLQPEEIRVRDASNGMKGQDLELHRLRTLNHIAEILNKSTDLRGALSTTLEGLVSVLGLRTGWVSLRKETAKFLGVDVDRQPHDFCLSASCNLPPELEQEQLKFLRQPPDCYCQKLLREGRLTHAVNIVECSRIRDAKVAAGKSGTLNYHATVPLATPDKIHGVLNIATEDWALFSGSDLKLLSIVGQQIASAVERGKLYEVTRMQQRRMQRELDIAKSVQSSFIPKQLPEIPGFKLAAKWQSAREVAGDFYDIFSLKRNKWGFAVADVSGKGVPAALYMATVRTLMRECKECKDPAEMLTQINRKLHAYSSSDLFVTSFCGKLEPNSTALVYANAGHDSPIVRRASGTLELLESTGPLLGVFGTEPFEHRSIDLEPGDTVVVYTDGITEARNGNDEEYGIERLKDIISSFGTGWAAQAKLNAIYADVRAFTGDVDQVDDITLFLIEKT